ncbi:MAG: glycosyltransferase family 4 protein [Actinomycetota bacterium]|jgi:glycosyltransferase involved in cell wall biosynthesis
MRIAFAKPDYGISGGFEVVLRRVERDLTMQGHTVHWLTADVAALDRAPFGVPVPPHVWEQSFEFFGYLKLVEAFRAVDAHRYDILISTQPPSFAVEHPRHLALFSHHHRVFYDLSEVYVAAGFADERLHRQAEAAVRRVDTPAFDAVTYFLAASEVVAERLRVFNGLSENVGVYHAGPGLPESLTAAVDTSRFEYPLCVSRHEFPKRTELFVHAMKYLPLTSGVSVGGGGRLPWVQSVDAQLAAPGSNLDSWGDRELWLRTVGTLVPPLPPGESNVRFVGHVTDSELAELYGAALCVVAPAYLEDYGLTALEAMAFGKPVIVCKDGGGLVDFVEDGKTGFVVEPNGRAIAEAIQTLADDPSLAWKMGQAAREAGSRYSWQRAAEEILAGLAKVTG